MNIRRKLRRIAASYGIKITFRYLDGTMAGFMSRTKPIFIALEKRLTEHQIISTFFHELGHFVDRAEGKYAKFYLITTMKRDKVYLRRNALRAELHADATGKKLMKSYFPELRYLKAYGTKKARQFLKDYYGI